MRRMEKFWPSNAARRCSVMLKYDIWWWIHNAISLSSGGTLMVKSGVVAIFAPDICEEMKVSASTSAEEIIHCSGRLM